MGQHRCAFIVQFERKECQDSNSSKSSGEIHILCGCCYAEGVREWRNSHFMWVLLCRRRSRVEKFIKCGCCYAEGVREWRNSHFMRVWLRRRRSRVSAQGCFNLGLGSQTGENSEGVRQRFQRSRVGKTTNPGFRRTLG